MKPRNAHRTLLAMLVTLCIALTGCANLAPVRTYAEETKKLTAAFDPMLAGSTSGCLEKYKRKKFITGSTFSPAEIETQAKALCAPIEESNNTIADLNSLLEQYADTLAALANEKLPTYKGEFDGLATAVGKLKKPNTSEALVPAPRLTAIASLASFLSNLATQAVQRSAIRDLLNQHEAVAAIADSLKLYATLNYRAWQRDQLAEFPSIIKSLEAAASSERLAARYILTLQLEEQRQIQAREKAVDAFVVSLDKMVSSHAELRTKLDSPDDKVLLKQLSGFADEVAALRKQLRDAF